MPERTFASERSAHLNRLQLAVSTVSDRVIRVRAEQGRPQTFAAGVGTGPAIRVQAVRGTHLRLRLNERFRVSSSGADARLWNATGVGYQYQLHTDTDEEILAFHWHPEQGWPDHPHLHFSSGAGALRPEFHRAHLPTGEIALEAFLAFVIRDFGVRPLRADYAAVLASRT